MIFNSVIVGSGGGGTGATVMAKAIGDAYHYGEGAKVILTPTGLVYSDTIGSTGPLTNALHEDYYLITTSGGVLSMSSSKFVGMWGRGNPGGHSTLSMSYNNDLSTLTGTLGVVASDSGNTFRVADYRDDNAVIACNMQCSSWSNPHYYGMGIIDRNTGVYTQLVNGGTGTSLRPGGASVAYAGKHACFVYCGAVAFDDNYNASLWTFNSSSYSLIPAYFNGSWYGIKGASVYAWGNTSTSSYSMQHYSDFPESNGHLVLPIDDEWTYSLRYNSGSSRWEIVRLNKSSSATWTLTVLTQPNNELATVEASTYGTDMVPGFKCKDYGSYVEIFYISRYVQPGSTPTSEVAHFKFHKATETLERLPDVFTGISSDWSAGTYLMGLQVNWQEGIIALSVYTHTDTTPYQIYRGYVTKYNEDAEIYKYYAYSYAKENFYPGCMTGVVKENKGVNAIGDWILEVETVEDPEYIFDNSDVLYGMEVTINPGI